MDQPDITKEQAVAAYGGNQAALARALGLTRQAVSAMPSGPLAERYALKLRYVLKPELFAPDVPGPAPARRISAAPGGDAAATAGIPTQPMSEAA